MRRDRKGQQNFVGKNDKNSCWSVEQTSWPCLQKFERTDALHHAGLSGCLPALEARLYIGSVQVTQYWFSHVD